MKDTTTIAVEGVADPVTVGTGDAKEMPPDLAEAMLGDPPAEPTARATLHLLAQLVTSLLRPPPAHDLAIAAELREVADLAASLPLTLADARDGFAILGMDRVGDPAPVTSRRRTCEELAALIARTHPRAGDGDPRRLASVLSVVAELYAGSTDERYLAIARTSIREVVELTGRQ